MYLQRLYAQMIEIQDDKFILMQMFFLRVQRKQIKVTSRDTAELDNRN